MEYSSRKQNMEDSNSSSKKKRQLIGIDYVGDGMYTMMLIKNDDMIPLRSSNNPPYLFRLAIDRAGGRENILMSDTTKEIFSFMKDAPDVSDLKNFILE